MLMKAFFSLHINMHEEQANINVNITSVLSPIPNVESVVKTAMLTIDNTISVASCVAFVAATGHEGGVADCTSGCYCDGRKKRRSILRLLCVPQNFSIQREG